METNQRTNLALGLLLILVGGWFLLIQFVPQLRDWFQIRFSWPLIIIGFGLLLLLIALFSKTPALAVPASIVFGVGSLLYWQNATGHWETWAYAWTLIPGFVGVGVLLAGLLGDREHRDFQAGLRMILISIILFFVFGSFLGGFTYLSPYWPILLIIGGLLFLFQGLKRRSLL